MKVTVGMATHDDFDGVYFSVQALRMYHDMRDVEILVIDNFGCDFTRDFMKNWVKNGRYVHNTEVTGTSAPRDLVFREATGDLVFCIDCHVMLMPGALQKTRKYFQDHPDCRDLVQGPMMYDCLTGLNTHFDPVWRDAMWGTWGNDPRGNDPEAEPFEIPMQGLGLFCSRKDAWLGFNPNFRGFGGEEGYIHEKYRQAGHRALCAPWLRWVHRFGRPYGVTYPLKIEDRIRNYFIGHDELKLDLKPIFEHFTPTCGKDKLVALAAETLGQGDYEKYYK